jgi:hypothetical protein
LKTVIERAEPMNLKEGTRRLALLLGVAGAILGGFASYSELQTVLNQRTRHNRFEQYATSDLVRQERNCIMGILSEGGCTEHLPGDRWDKYIVSPSYPNAKRVSLPNGEIRDYPNSMSDEQITNILRKEFPAGAIVVQSRTTEQSQAQDPYAATAIQTPLGDPYAATAMKVKPTVAQVLQDPKFYGLPPVEQKKVLSRLDSDFRQLPAQEQDKVLAISKSKLSPPQPNSVLPPRQPELDTTTGVALDFSTSVPIPSVVMKGGIKTVNWNHDYGIDSIEMEDGQTIYPTHVPSAWMYLLIALFPVLGFFIPWGAVRAIGWVGAGFVASPK